METHTAAKRQPRPRQMPLASMSVEDLREYAAQLEDALGLNLTVFPAAWRLPRMQRRLLGLLLERPALTNEVALAALYGRHNDAPTPKILAVYITHLRKALNPHGVQITTLHSDGYYLDNENKALLRALIAASN